LSAKLTHWTVYVHDDEDVKLPCAAGTYRRLITYSPGQTCNVIKLSVQSDMHSIEWHGESRRLFS